MKDNKVIAVAKLLGKGDCVQNGVLTIEKSGFVFTLREKDDFLDAEVLFDQKCPLNLMDRAAVKLARANFRVALSGFFMDQLGNYGQRHKFSPHDANENIAFCCFIMIREANNYIIAA